MSTKYSQDVKSALWVLSGDMHATSTRPCSTCKAMTESLGKPFGCDSYRIRIKELTTNREKSQ